MVQLPATAAIEYVAAGHFFPGDLLPGGTFGRGHFWPGGFLSGRAFVRGAFVRGVFCPGGLLSGGAYARSPQVQCVYAPSRLSVRSIVAWRTKKQTDKQTKKRQTRPPSSAGSRPPLPKFSGYVEVEAHYIFHPSTIWIRPLFTELGPKNPQKSRFCHEANECRLSGDIMILRVINLRVLPFNSVHWAYILFLKLIERVIPLSLLCVSVHRCSLSTTVQC